MSMKVNDKQHFKFFQAPFTLPSIEVIVNQNLEFAVLGLGWSLPADAEIYKTYSRSLRNVTISSLLTELKSMELCEGLPNPSSRTRDHVIQEDVGTSNLADGCRPQPKVYHRSQDCAVFVEGTFTVTLLFN